MRKYRVVHRNRRSFPIARLEYDERRETFYLSIEKSAQMDELPGLLGQFALKGMYKPGGEWSTKWVLERLIPEDRQGIGHMLKSMNMTHYDPCAIMEASQGKCDGDDLLILPEKPEKSRKKQPAN